MNTALVEMAGLLPPLSLTAKENDDRDGNGIAKVQAGAGAKSPEVAAQGASKAATVESAIEYIRALKRDAEARDSEIEELRERLREAEKRIQGMRMSEGVK